MPDQADACSQGYRTAQGRQPFKVFFEAGLVSRKTRDGGSECILVAVRQHEGLADRAAAHLVKMADVDELKVAVEAEGSDQPGLRIVLVKTVDLVQRRFDGKSIVTVYVAAPPKLSLRSRTRTRKPARAHNAAAVRPPRPEPMTIALNRRGMRHALKSSRCSIRDLDDTNLDPDHSSGCHE